MSKIAWDALIRFGISDLRLNPEVFWSLTPRELSVLAGSMDDDGALDRSGFERLMAQFPDEKAN